MNWMVSMKCCKWGLRQFYFLWYDPTISLNLKKWSEYYMVNTEIDHRKEHPKLLYNCVHLYIIYK